jgi:outer membrane lipase/esterase
VKNPRFEVGLILKPVSVERVDGNTMDNICLHGWGLTMYKTKQFALFSALLVFTFLGEARAEDFNQFVAFGDSTLDTGYFRYHTTGSSTFDKVIASAVALGANGGWAGNGKMNTTILAEKFRLIDATIDAGGTNYANGGATTVTNNAPVVPTNVTTIQQIRNYLSSVNGAANSKALYLIKTGDNDADYVTKQGADWIAAHPNYLSDGAAALAAEVAHLQAAGARFIVVRNSYDAALFAGIGGDIPSSNAAAYARSVALGISEWSSLTAAGVNFIPADNDSLFRYVVKNPTRFGFTGVSVLAANGSALSHPYPFNSALTATLTPAEQQNFLFIDGKHLTTAGQTIEADYTYSLIIAPNQISLLAESAVQSGLARSDTIQGQMDLSGKHRGPGRINLWASAGINGLSYQNVTGFPGSSGTPFGGTVGVDYQISSAWIAGAAFTSVRQTQKFSTSGGFDQLEETPSLYAAYKSKRVWGDAVASYGLLQDEIARPVNLGIFTDQNHAKTSGHSLALAVRAGIDFSRGRIAAGPVAGIVLQRVDISGFTEAGDSGVTALLFESQQQTSFVSQLGWRAAVNAGIWQLLAEAKWNHEWAGNDRTIRTSLTSVSAAPYVMNASPAPSNWASTSFGATCNLSSRVALRSTGWAMGLNPQVTRYGAELGLNIGF